jgi:glycosyltransferase involved in cell wall biosynthesis
MKKINKKKPVIVFALPGLGVGGIEKQFVKQTKYFNYKKYTYVLITLFQIPNSPELYHLLPKKIKVYKLHIQHWWSIKSVSSLFKIFKKIRPRIVVSSTFTPNTVCTFLKIFCTYTLITREHSIYREKRIWHHILDHLSSYFIYTIIAVSKIVAEKASEKRKVPLKKFTIIHNGVEILPKIPRQKARHTLQKKYLFPEDAFILLHVGRLMPVKDQNLLIESFSLYRTLFNKNCFLFIVGGGPLEEKLKEKASLLSLEKNIFITGNQNDMSLFYCASDILILTSQIEGFVNVGLEGMSFGIPFISTKVGESTVYIKNKKNGLLTKNTKEDIAEKIEIMRLLLLKNKLSIEKKCLDTAKRYSMKKNVLDYENIFKKILRIQ